MNRWNWKVTTFDLLYVILVRLEDVLMVLTDGGKEQFWSILIPFKCTITNDSYCLFDYEIISIKIKAYNSQWVIIHDISLPYNENKLIFPFMKTEGLFFRIELGWFLRHTSNQEVLNFCFFLCRNYQISNFSVSWLNLLNQWYFYQYIYIY